MGWTCFREKPADVRRFLTARLTGEAGGESQKALDLAIVNLREAYTAVETIHADGRRSVWAAITLLEFHNRPNEVDQFCFKDLTEFDGPVVDRCPERILRLLTPFESDANHQYAVDWRRRCWTRVSRRTLAKAATRFKAPTPIKVGGVAFTVFEKLPGRNLYLSKFDSGRPGYRVKLPVSFIDEGRIVPCEEG